MDRRIDLERARRDAKALLRAARAGDAAALARMRPDRAPRLADAQRAVAVALGAPSWPALLQRVQGEGAALIRAARQGRAGEVYALLDAGAPADARDPETGGTALHVAARRGDLDVVSALVGWVPLDRHARDASGATALGACVAGARERDGHHLLVAQVLVANGLRPEPWMLDGAAGRGAGAGGAAGRDAVEEVVAWLRERLEAPARAPSSDPAMAEAALAADAALFAHLAASPLAARTPVGDGFAFVTGLLDNTRNGIVCSRASDAEIATALETVAGRPAQWLLGPGTEPGDLAARLERAGCEPERSAVCMGVELADLSPAEPPEGVEIVSIRDRGRLAEALDDPDEANLLASLGLGDDHPLRHFAAHRGDKPIGIVSAFAHGTTLSVIHLEVARPERRAGLGRALLLHALDDGAARGCARAVLAPTPATVTFYERLGFALVPLPPDRAFHTP